MKEKQKEGSDEKQELAKQREEKRQDNLDSLKAKGGPFTDEREVDESLAEQYLMLVWNGVCGSTSAKTFEIPNV